MKLIRRKIPKKKITYRSGGEGFVKWCNDFVRIEVYEKGLPVWRKLSELSTETNIETGRCSKEMWEAQQEIALEALKMENNRFVYRLVALCWMRGEGKCASKGSKVIMHNGTVKKVEDIKVGDTLMGDDSTPRKVLSLANGTAEMFRVIPMRGEPLTVNKDHILSLKTRCMSRRRAKKKENRIDPNEGKVIDISLRDYMKQNKYFKRKHLLFRVPVEFPEQEVSIDPYFLGLWLGDGSSNCTHVTTMDKEIVDYLKEYADQLGLRVTHGEKKDNRAKTYRLVGERLGTYGSNVLLNRLRNYDLIKNKHIPQEYKVNSREVRLQVLAGLIDSDGWLNRNSFGIMQKNKTLAEDIAFLARSLGFHACIAKRIKTIKNINFSGKYYSIGISGDCSVIPVHLPRKKASKRKNRKDILVTTIKEIKSVGEGEYYGFNLDGNGRYVTGDFTVTHNSLFVCLVQLWKFFNFQRQKIMLGANSRDQVKFVHFDIIRDIILNSPKLLKRIGKRNIQEKEIRFRNAKGEIGSIIRSISSFSGIVSNITGYTFSEMFDMKNPKFFTQLDGSIRNVPNALGVIDSTVSTKDHILYRLYDSYRKGLDRTLFFSHRESLKASHKDFWNPEMTQKQLNSYRTKFPSREFAMYFKNTWDAGSKKMFPESVITAMKYIGFNNSLGEQGKILRVIEAFIKEREENKGVIDWETRRSKALDSLLPIESIYSLKSEHLQPRAITLDELEKLSDVYDTHFSLCCGVDRADPMKVDITVGAKTIVCLVAKGLPGSRSNPTIALQEDTTVQNYVYFLVDLKHIEHSDINSIKFVIEDYIDEFDGIDTLCTERWGMWDVGDWCDDNEIEFQPITAAYTTQKDGFSELFTLIKTGRFKSPATAVKGVKEDDLLEEELLIFDHDSVKKFYGSPEKREKFGIQDDAVFAINWGIYGGRFLTVDDFRMRNVVTSLGEFYKDDKNLIGNYT